MVYLKIDTIRKLHLDNKRNLMKFFRNFFTGIHLKKNYSQNNRPKISIIVPTYNSAVNLHMALESIKNQTFKNIEVLIIDGASSDNTLKIAQNYRSKFQFYTVISEPDKGIYDAMNKGIRIAKGEWLYFLGSDDSFYEQNTLEELFSHPEIRNNDVIYGNVYSSRFDLPYDGEFSYSKLAKKNICHQSIFFRKNVFKKIGVFNIKYKVWADWDHNIRWFYSSRIKKHYINKIIANYADGGFSSLHMDEFFQRQKNLKLLMHGFIDIPAAQRRDICNLAILQSKKENSFWLYRGLKLIGLILKIDKFFTKK